MDRLLAGSVFVEAWYMARSIASAFDVFWKEALLVTPVSGKAA